MNWTDKDIGLIVSIVGITTFLMGMFIGERDSLDKVQDGIIIENGDKVYRVVEVKKVVTYQDIASSPVTSTVVYSGEK